LRTLEEKERLGSSRRCRKVCIFGDGKRRKSPSAGFYFPSQACGMVISRAGIEMEEEEAGKDK
jgi:hypothetical protein